MRITVLCTRNAERACTCAYANTRACLRVCFITEREGRDVGLEVIDVATRVCTTLRGIASVRSLELWVQLTVTWIIPGVEAVKLSI